MRRDGRTETSGKQILIVKDEKAKEIERRDRSLVVYTHEKERERGREGERANE